MKKFFAAVSIYLLLLLPHVALGVGQQTYLLLNGVTTNVCTADLSFAQWNQLKMKFVSAGASNAQLTVGFKSADADTYVVYITVTNPTNTGEYWGVPITYKCQVCVINYVSGVLTVWADAKSTGQ